jgi:peptidoglycan/LPS O-acetylase OafA/YrhL
VNQTAIAEPATTVAATDGRRRIPELDGIRGVAISLVLVWHYLANPIQRDADASLRWVGRYLSLSWSGVDLFFVLSGFLLGGILLESRNSADYSKTFYARRAVRILPIYYVLVAVAAIAVWLGLARINPATAFLLDQPLPFWSYLTFTQNFLMADAKQFGASALSVTWSLAIEEQFYLLLPVMIRVVPREKLAGVLLMGILGAPLCRLFLILFQDPTGFTGLVMMPARADTLLLGVLVALGMREYGLTEWLSRNRAGAYLGFVALLTGAIALARFGSYVPSVVSHVVGHAWLASLYAALLLLALTDPRGPIGLLARNPLLRSLGLVSYGVYLFHQPVLYLVHGFTRNQFPVLRSIADGLTTAAALGVTLLMAFISWHLLEKPILTLGHRLKY